MIFYQFIAGTCFTLEVLIIHYLWASGWWRKYIALFAYCLMLLFTDIVEWSLLFGGVHRNSKIYITSYWVDESLRQVLIFCLMVALIHKATMNCSRLRWTSTGIAALGAAVCLALVSWGSQPGTAPWNNAMIDLSRNLSFCSALLNTVLWTVLLRSRTKEYSLLLIAAGIGLQTTGKAIGHSLRRISPEAITAGNVAIVFTFTLCLLIWWYVFRRAYHGRNIASAPAPAGGVVHLKST